VLFRFNLVGRLFRYLTWTFPVIVSSCALAIILLALA